MLCKQCGKKDTAQSLDDQRLAAEICQVLVLYYLLWQRYPPHIVLPLRCQSFVNEVFMQALVDISTYSNSLFTILENRKVS